jgi:hypothetical protein
VELDRAGAITSTPRCASKNRLHRGRFVYIRRQPQSYGCCRWWPPLKSSTTPAPPANEKIGNHTRLSLRNMNVAKLAQDGAESFTNLQSLQQSGSSLGNSCPLTRTYGLQIYAATVPKIPIPLLRKAASSSRRRTTQACGPCRERKIKCSGETPECQRCGSAQTHCWYPATTKQQKER